MAVNVSASHLAPAGQVMFEPQRSFNFELIIPGLGDGTELIRLSVESVTGLATQNAVIDLRYQNESRKVAGGYQQAGQTVSVRDFVDKNILRVLLEWRRLVHNPTTGEIGYAADYKRDSILRLLDPKGEVKRNIILKGVWPSSLSTTPVNYNSVNGEVKINMTLEVDMYDIESV